MTFFQYIADTFTNFRFIYIFDILIISLIIFWLLFYIRKHNAGWYAKFIVIAITFAFGLAMLGTREAFFVICMFLMCLVIISAVLFSSEIKRDLFRLSWKSRSILSNKNVLLSHEEIESTIVQIVEACQNMSKQDVGALIIIVPDTISDYIIESGTYLNAKISSELLETIFFPKSPLHDGAVLIKGDKVIAAGCYLPLSQTTSLPKDVGTRHRAAYGMTETNPSVTAIVVSEETGIISSFYDGEFKRYLDAKSLTETLEIGYSINRGSTLDSFKRGDYDEE